MIALLLELGADANRQDSDGWTPVLHAAFRNHAPSIKALATHKANLDAADKNNVTALGYAISEGNFFAAKALLEAGASPNERIGPEAVTPIMLIATRLKTFKRAGQVAQGADPTEIAKDLIARGADVNAISKEGITALMIAARQDNQAMIGLLYQAGADLRIKSLAGKTALDIATEARNAAAEKSLKLFASLKKRQSGSINEQPTNKQD
jgi:ankyrin repeat protein